MMIVKNFLILSTLLLLVLTGCKTFQKSVGKVTGKTLEETDSTDKKADAKPYDKIITPEAISEEGLFDIHQIDDQWLMEIPDSLFGIEFLIVTRVKKAAANEITRRKLYIGEIINNNMALFERGPGNKVFLRLISVTAQSTDTTSNGLYQSVQQANLQPIAEVFDIKTFSNDSSSVVIDLTPFINGDSELLFFTKEVKKRTGVNTMAKDRSYVEQIRAFPKNVEVNTVKTYVSSDKKNYTYELNTSFRLLPQDLMTPTYRDPRVGYKATAYVDFDEHPQGVETLEMITRWRLEPKPEDRERYARGELVEPVHPIVFYIDSNAPKKWIPYLKQGVNDWQSTFEKAGFKNAIYALEAPVDDPDWNIEDARHNAIVYNASTETEIKSHNIFDPRTGEILLSNIIWPHNLLAQIRLTYMIQAGAVDPAARTLEPFEEELMGRLIRAYCAHEIGHTLGLRDNLGASSTVPTDSLRSESWLLKNGHTPSIMDLSRFNYVAQPEDDVTREGIMPRVGVYDRWAIEWGYRWLPEPMTRKERDEYLDKWIAEELGKDNRLWFGGEPEKNSKNDPRRQAEDLGDDLIRSADYGIKNLKYIVPLLNPRNSDWTVRPHTAQEVWAGVNHEVSYKFLEYMRQVTRLVGGMEWTDSPLEEAVARHHPVPEKKQKEALEFIRVHLFTAPLDWLYQVNENETIYSYGLYAPTWITMLYQKDILMKLLSFEKLNNLHRIDTEFNAQDAFSVKEYLNELKKSVWGELSSGKPISRFKRNLQKIYIEQLIMMAYPRQVKGVGTTTLEDIEEEGNNAVNTDVMSYIKGHRWQLIEELDAAIRRYPGGPSLLHLKDVRDRLERSVTSDDYLQKMFIQPTMLR